ncbi:hypothetical protein CERSUDRAFT_87231 [Gelatoporia subvermispora B]|uniref:Golgi apparatus membrane protein TVP38 n=1 Tax=Ceriporiopsis subvermispora (strain B) TaxID=914234 RepID=M2Q909_CERS8|nr:hypothetical protein CERSUDRAFT_87231 [Gelatoporia subvermispora B]
MPPAYPPPYGPDQLELPVFPLASKSASEPGSRSPSDVAVDVRELARTPSPTPSEEAALYPEPFDPSKIFTAKFWFNRRMLLRLVIIALAVCFALTFTVFRKQIANALSPAADWMHNLTAGWLIPIAIMIVMSFPPLFGHEIVAILCGFVWGVGPGFAIVAAGTFLGELTSFLVFRYCCLARGLKMERTNIRYACLARVVRKGGFRVVLIMRYSAIPSHFSTAVFSTCGIPILVFCAAAVLSLPKQLVTVFLGSTLTTSSDGESHTDKVVERVVLVITIAATVLGLMYINRRTKAVLPDVIYARRKARQAKLRAVCMRNGRTDDRSAV